jgi:hypothetical protein
MPETVSHNGDGRVRRSALAHRMAFRELSASPHEANVGDIAPRSGEALAAARPPKVSGATLLGIVVKTCRPEIRVQPQAALGSALTTVGRASGSLASERPGPLGASPPTRGSGSPALADGVTASAAARRACAVCIARR